MKDEPQVQPQVLPPVQVFTARGFPDERGMLIQSWVAGDLAQRGIPSVFHQAIQTCSKRGVIRGLHFQWDPPMGKLVRCLHGAIVDVVVDVRHGSPTLGKHLTVECTAENRRVVWVPAGFAHGTFALEDDTIVLYECSVGHGPGEGGILWNDATLGIHWPDIPPIVSEKDRVAAPLEAWLADPRSQHFRME